MLSYSAPLKAYIVQFLIAIVFVTLSLCLLAKFTDTLAFRIIGATSISASTFILLTRPDCESASLFHMLGSYAIALLIGLFAFFINHHLHGSWLQSLIHYQTELIAALAFGVSMIVMLLLKLNHPPAAGLGVAIVINTWDLPSLWVIVGSILLLAIVKRLLMPYLKPL